MATVERVSQICWHIQRSTLTETEDIKKRWQEHIEEPYKKDLQDPDNDDGVITDLEPDILDLGKHHYEQS